MIRWFFVGFTGLLVALALGLAAWRVAFILLSAVAEGEVVEIVGGNGSCGLEMEACSRFVAELHFDVADETFSVFTGAGSTPGHDQLVEGSVFVVGDQLDVRYLAEDPNVAFVDRFWDLWWQVVLPLALAAMVLPLAFMSGTGRHGPGEWQFPVMGP